MTNKESSLKRAVVQFVKTTTLHGFKYLCSKYYIDRVGWVISCAASTCCAGLLCAVLWARFMEVPAVLELLDIRAGEDVTQFWPDVAVCPPIALESFFNEHMGLKSSMSRKLSGTVSHILTGKPSTPEKVKRLEKFLDDHNITLTELLLRNTPSCDEMAITCRWQNSIVPCKYLFEKERTNTGVCCIMKPDRLYWAL